MSSQFFQVLRCYKCLVFQVHQTKKSNKWQCKLCGEKQSIKRHYGLGTGKECRLHVQKLNEMRGKKEELHDLNNEDSDEEFEDSDEEIDNSENTHLSANVVEVKKASKWSEYIDETEDSNKIISDENMHLFDTEVVLELPKKRKKDEKEVFKIKISEMCSDNKNMASDQFPVFFDNFSHCKLNSKPFVSSNVIHKENPYSNVDNNLEQQYNLMKKKGVAVSKFNAPSFNKTSKWAQFITETETCDNEDINVTTSIKINTQNIFSLCDDNDLDCVLDI